MKSIKLQENDIVDIIFPATCCTESEIAAIKNYVKNELNLIPRILFEEEITPTKTENLTNEFPSFPAKTRFKQFYQALKNKDSKIVWCARGGYGSGDILSFLSKAKKIKQNKIFIGFSDVCSVTTFLQDQWKWQILCAPVLAQLSKNIIEKEAVTELKNLIFSKKTKFNYDLIALNNIKKTINKSFISGGCISVLAGHFGTKYQINFQNKILFLEDEGEDGERLDRYFRQIIDLILTTKKKPKAILLGNFMEANPHGAPKANNIEIAINRFVERIKDSKLKIPVFLAKDKDLGHSKKMRPLMLGCNSKIISKPRLQLEYKK